MEIATGRTVTNCHAIGIMSETQIVTDSDREIRFIATFDATPEEIYRYHTDPDLIGRWLLGPPGTDSAVCSVDLRVGGRFMYTWPFADGRPAFSVGGQYREIAPPNRLVFTEHAAGGHESAVCTLTLSENGERTQLTNVVEFPDTHARDTAAASGMPHGMKASYERLAELVRKQ